MKVRNFEIKEGFFYSKNYGWAKIEGDTALVGINDVGLKMAEEVQFINLPKVGTRVEAGQKYGDLESIKWHGELVSPLSGEVVEVNREIYDEPPILNKDPYGKGWIIKIRLSNKDEAKQLMDAEKYCEWVEENVK